MREIKILKDVEKEVEAIFLHAQALADFYKKYPQAVRAVLSQFQLKDYTDSNFIPDDIDNLKIRLYTYIIKGRKVNKERKKQKLEKLKKKLK